MDKLSEANQSQFIQMLRGISVFLVAYYHYTDRLPWREMHLKDLPDLPFYSGKIGVYIFFLLSAYLIAKSIEACHNLGEFYAKRISRIWPLFVCASIVIYLFLQVMPPPVIASGPKQFYEQSVTLTDLFGTIFLLEDFGFNWVDGVFWSILVELKFYLLAGLAACLFKKSYIKVFATVAAALAMLDWAIAISPLAPHAGIVTRALHGLLISQYLPFFALGMLVYKKDYGPLFIANLMLAAAQLVTAIASNPDLDGAATVRFIVVVSALVLTDFTLLRGRVLTFLGDYSYALYLFHQMIGLTLIVRLTPALGFEGAMLVAAGVVLAISYTASKAVEWRFRRPTAAVLLKIFSMLRLDRVSLPTQSASQRPTSLGDTPPQTGILTSRL